MFRTSLPAFWCLDLAASGEVQHATARNGSAVIRVPASVCRVEFRHVSSFAVDVQWCGRGVGRVLLAQYFGPLPAIAQLDH